MGLNLDKWKKKEANDSIHPTSTNQETVHNAPSQPTNVSSSSSVLSALANLSTASSSGSNSNAQAGKEASSKSAGSVEQSAAIEQQQQQQRTIRYQEISDRIVELRESIHGAHPRMPGLLQEIWKTMRLYPEQVTLLEEDQMEVIIAGLEKVVDTDLAAVTIKSAVSGKKSKQPVSSAELGF